MSLAKIYTMQAIDTDNNGGYYSLTDGITETTTFIEKDGVTIELNTKDTIELMKAMNGINPTVSIY